MLMIVVRLAYPAPPRGSHKGVPLRWCKKGTTGEGEIPRFARNDRVRRLE